MILATFSLSPAAPRSPPPAQLGSQPNYVAAPVRPNPSTGGDVTGGPVTIACAPGVGAGVTLALFLVWGPPGGPPAQVDVPVLLPVPVGGSAQFVVPSGTVGSVAQPAQSPNLQLGTPPPALVAQYPGLSFATPLPPPIADGSACLGVLVECASGQGSSYAFTVTQ